MESPMNQPLPLRIQSLPTRPNQLEKLFGQLKNVSIDQLLQDPEAGWHTCNRIRELITNWRYYRTTPSQQRYFKQLTSQVAHTFLRKALVTGSIRYTIYLLLLAAYLEIKPEEIPCYLQVPRQKARKLVQAVSRVLLAIKIDLNAASGAPSYELRLLQKGRQAVAQLQIKEAYQLLEAMDNGRRGVSMPFPISAFIRLLAALDYQQFVNVLKQQQEPFTLGIYLRELPADTRYRLGADARVDNLWALFELLRKLVATEKRAGYSPVEQASSLAILTSLHKLHLDFFQQTVDYFHASQLVNAALGCLLATWPVLDAVSLLQTSLPIDRYKTMQAARTELLLVYDQQVVAPQVLQFLTKVFIAWEAFLDQFQQDKTMHLSDVLETDYWLYIINYYRLTYDQKTLVSELVAVFTRIQWLKSDWHANEAAFLKAFYLHYTKLYALSWAYQQQQNTILAVQQLANAIEVDIMFVTRNMRGIEHFAKLLSNLRQ
jgi:hypothetical protein